jgi:hypothetical protein
MAVGIGLPRRRSYNLEAVRTLGGELRTSAQLARLCGAITSWLSSSQPVRKFMRIEANSPSYSKRWHGPSGSHLVDMLVSNLKQPRHISGA